MSVLDNLKAANVTASASGTFPIIKNSANGKFKNLKLFGASTQAANQTPDNPQEISSVVLNSIAACGKNLLDCSGLTAQTTAGITFTPIYKNDELQYININGTWDPNNSASNTRFKIGTWNPQKTGDYILSGMSYLNDLSYLCLDKNGDGGAYEVVATTNKEFTVSEDAKFYDVWVRIANGVSVSNLKIYPMIRPASIENADYEPYKAIISNLPEAIEMNGIEELKDYIDYERGVFVQKFGVVVFDGSSDEKWEFNELSQRITISGLPIKRTSNNDEIPNILCNQFLTKSPNQTYQKVEGITVNTYGVLHIYSDNFNTADVSLWKAHLQANPMHVVYELAEPIETPLSPAALLELNKLRTFDSITCVSNDAGAEMEIDYFKNNATGQEMSDIHAGVPRFILDGTTLNIIV